MKYSKDQKGISLILVFFMMVIITSAVLFMGVFLGSRIITIRNISRSVASFYLADSGVEKVLYYDRKVLEGEGEGGGEGQIDANRGLCFMCYKNEGQKSCPDCECVNEEGEEDYVYKNPGQEPGCDPENCTDCTVYFNVDLDNDNNNDYFVKATVFPEGSEYDMDVQSTGFLSGISRAIMVLINRVE